MMNVGDDVTINGKIYDIRRTLTGKLDIFIVSGGGNILCIGEEDINTHRPKIEVPEKDMRKGD